jgi:hypothetical protein
VHFNMLLPSRQRTFRFPNFRLDDFRFTH